MTVAMAAPRIPMAGKPNRPKIKMGSRIRFVTAPATRVSMLPTVFPTDCKNRWNMVLTKVPRQKSIQMERYSAQAPPMKGSLVNIPAKLSVQNRPRSIKTAAPRRERSTPVVAVFPVRAESLAPMLLESSELIPTLVPTETAIIRICTGVRKRHSSQRLLSQPCHKDAVHDVVE